MAANKSITLGDRFTRWTVISEPFKRGSHWAVNCVCSCGTSRPVRIEKLLSGNSRSCGCLRDENLTTHGHTSNWLRKQSSEYWVWNSMLQRTTNPSNIQFKEYGGRGIGVSDDWRVFQNFFRDMGYRPSPKHSLERVNNDLGYSKENCRWATRVEQNRNKRDNRRLTANGVTKTLAEWSEDLGCSHATIIGRIKRGWSEEDAVTRPARKFKNKVRQDP